jgi:hypothetical protein
MQAVATGWTAEERDTTRKIVASTQVSWKKSFDSTIALFTIGVSTIGGVDTIASEGGITSDWNKYQYDDESEYLTGLSYERNLQVPIGGVAKAIAEVNLDNTNGRFTPRYMGGNSELFTAVVPRRPIIINAGFNYDGIDNQIPQFVGVTTKTPETSLRNSTTKLQADDFLGFLQNRYVDNTSMFTGLSTDTVIGNILTELGYATAQYNLDPGISIIPFGLFEVGTRYIDIINKLVQAENGNFYQDETGVLRFENRQHYDSAPYTQVQRVLATSQVIEAKAPNESHIINVVEVRSKPRAKQTNQLVFTLSGTKELAAGADFEIFINFDDPMLSIDNPVYVANTLSDGTGTDVTSSISLKAFSKFAKSCKITFRNNSTGTAFITNMTMYGRPAKVTTELYTRMQDDSSVTAYEERPYKIENDYIQSQSWANSFAQMVLNDFSDPESLQEITIRALPELQMGDLISWQGRYWRIYGIKTSISPSGGFLQTIKILQRTIVSYFRIGISTIGGTDQIAP